MAELREHSVGALLELFELSVAVGETTLNAQRVCAAVRELAAEAAQLAEASSSVPARRLQGLAEFARTTATTAELQASALVELKLGLADWGIG
ncbi:MAG TPA: hypothetical protein VNG33_21555 [Polyangiaceae bacterium]|nr:hypothetical protein [Polyangiaceae bacterium]